MRTCLTLLCCLLLGMPARMASAALPSFESAVHAQVKREPGGVARALLDFYQARGFQPAWFSEDGEPGPQARQYLEALGGMEAEGLSPERYGRSELEAALAGLQPGDDWMQVELRLTGSFLTLALHLRSGQVSSRRLRWWARPPEAEALSAALEWALTSGDMAGTLGSLSPRYPGFRWLRETLARYRAIAATGGWPLVPRGALLVPGARSPRVAVLRERLLVTGDLAPELPAPGEEDVYDARLRDAVQDFQQRHGLEVDGKVGRETLAALRVPVEERITQLEVNLERWRWLPEELGPRHVVVNLPAFELEAVDEGQRVLRMPVVIGLPDWSTPVLSSEIRSLVLNPEWNVPRDIAAQEVLPSLREYPGAAERLGLTVLDPVTGVEVGPWTVDWHGQEDAAPTVRFMQLPGEANPMGAVKFTLPNRYAIYLHGTPDPGLFTEVHRAFSHGCVRVADPLSLADFLLQGEGGWTRDALGAAMREGGMPLRRNLQVKLSSPVPVYLLYWTAFVDDTGQVQFRPDLYREDSAVRRALETAAARPT